MKKVVWPIVTIIVLVIAFLMGPKVASPQLDREIKKINMTTGEVEKWVNESEATNPLIKPDNEARIVWNDSSKNKTPYSIVYLHGWSASQAEGDPIHREVAKRYGCNLYLSRLAYHGLNEDEPMLEITAEKLLVSAKEAIAIGEVIGERVIVMATSNGGTLGLYLAGGNSDIEALILYSPNIDIYDPMSNLLDEHWGLEMARLVKGSNYHQWELNEQRQKYWTSKYRLEALVQLRELVDETMTMETFEKVTQPVFMGYYYKNDTAQDMTVSVPAMLKMFESLGTPTDKKRKVAFPEVGHHVIGSSMTSNDVKSVRKSTFKFVDEVLKLKKTTD